MTRLRRWSGVASLVAGTVGVPAQADSVHVVQPGETLWAIASDVTGDPHRWPELYRANRDQIKDPARLYPGQQLTIPDLGPGRVSPRAAEGGFGIPAHSEAEVPAPSD